METYHGTVWSPVSISLRSDELVSEPYTNVRVTATFTSESGQTYEIPGFWDGGNKWEVRFAPPAPGTWEWATSADPGISGLERSGVIEAAGYAGEHPLRSHGFLTRGSDNRSLQHADGTPFFWFADTAWPAPAKATPAEWRRYLAKRASQGFNVVQMNALPQWDASRPRGRDPFGAEWDYDDPDPAYFDTLDTLIELTHDAGMIPALVALWYDYVPGERDARPHTFSTEQASRFGRYLAARYGAYGTVWLVSGDSELPEETLEYYDAAARAIRKSVTHPLCTLHLISSITTSQEALDRDWFDFHLYQSGHHVGDRQYNAYRYAETSRELEPTRPIINGEPCYEEHGYFEEPDLRVSRESARRAAWWSILAGANAGITYGAHGIWHWHRQGEHVPHAEDRAMPVPWTDALEFPGADDYAFLASILSTSAFETLQPNQAIVPEASEQVRAAELLADDTLLIYTPEVQSLTIDPAAMAVEVTEYAWIDPATGDQVPADVDEAGDSRTAAPPFWNGDGLLIGQ